MRPRPSLPAPARHEAAARLVGLGVYPEAQSLLGVEQPEDAELGILTSLLAGDPRTAAKFLGRRMMASATRSGEVDLIRACVALVSGHTDAPAGALDIARDVLSRMQPTSRDLTVFAVTAAPHDLRVAARAAGQVTEPAGAAVLSVLAAARAAGGDVHGAHDLLESAAWNGVGDDPRQRTVDLLKTHDHEAAVQALDAVRFQKRSLTESLSRRMSDWQRRRGERDLRCRCVDTPAWAGASSRYYVNWHLELQERVHVEGAAADDETSWRILYCTRSGVRYLDLATIPVSVRTSI